LSATTYREYAPPPQLAAGVECFWTSSVETDLAGHRVLPDGCVDVLFSDEEGLRVVGTMTRPRSFDLRTGVRFVAARLRPAASAAILGLPGGLIVDRVLPWSGSRSLPEQLANTQGHEEQVRLIASALPVVDPDGPDRVAAWMVRRRGQVDMDEAARLAGVGPRHLRRLFLDRIGLTPKRFCRILRFRHAVSMGRRRHGWAEIAAACGYYDQAHMIRDFREFAGLSPDDWRVSVFSNTAPGRNSYDDEHEDHAHSLCRRD
jgi:AraC-like DNA-binding protein